MTEVIKEKRRPFVIFNPASGRGRGLKQIEAYLPLLQKHFGEVASAATSRPGEEGPLAEAAIRDGKNLIVAVGGDGTWGNVADRIVASGQDDVALGILATGTGNDFGRNFGLGRRSPEEAVRILAQGRCIEIDVGRVNSPGRPVGVHADTLSHDGPRHFINLIGFGFDVAVIQAAAGARFLRGPLLYKVTALRQLLAYRTAHLTLLPEGEPDIAGSQLMLTISNGPFFGGGIMIAPAAEIHDGKLDAVAIGDTSALGRLRLFNAAEKGQHVLSKHVHTRRSKRFRVEFDAPPRYELDGDLWQAESNVVEVETLPNALKVMIPQ